MSASRAQRAPAPRGSRAFGHAGRAALMHLGADGAAALAAASDLALVIDPAGVVIDAAASGGGATGLSAAPEPGHSAMLDGWVGRRWVDTVTPDSRAKIELLLREANAAGGGPRRQVNHVASDGHDVPVTYAAVRLDDGSVVAVGRDLRAVAALQQRLVETQQALERDYWRLRHVETRYRLLFQRSRDAVLVVDADTRKVVDANEAAGALFGSAVDRLVGRAFPPESAVAARQTLNDLLASARTEGHGDDVEIMLADGRAVRVAASYLRQEAQTLFLVRFAEEDDADANVPDAAHAALQTLLETAPDAFVVTDADGRVLTANRAFVALAQLGDAAHADGRSLGEWLGRPGADLPLLLAMLRQHGVVRLLGTAVRGEHGTVTDVELSAVSAPDGAEPAVAWTIRDVGRRVGGGTGGARDLSRAVEQLTRQVGRVSLPDLVRDTVQMVERHFVEAALTLTQGNRTAAAEVLGLSRQSLYLKLRRHRLLSAEGADADPSG